MTGAGAELKVLSLHANYAWMFALMSTSDESICSVRLAWIQSALMHVFDGKRIVDEMVQPPISSKSTRKATTRLNDYLSNDSSDLLHKQRRAINEDVTDIANYMAHWVNLMIRNASTDDKWLSCSSDANDMCISWCSGSVDTETLYVALSTIVKRLQAADDGSLGCSIECLAYSLSLPSTCTISEVRKKADAIEADVKSRLSTQSSISGTLLADSCKLMCGVCIALYQG